MIALTTLAITAAHHLATTYPINLTSSSTQNISSAAISRPFYRLYGIMLKGAGAFAVLMWSINGIAIIAGRKNSIDNLTGVAKGLAIVIASPLIISIIMWISNIIVNAFAGSF